MLTLADFTADQPGRAMLTGRTVWLASRSDPRFSYGLYVPACWDWDGAADVVVSIHGTHRSAQLDRECWVAFAETHGVVIVTPLFPAALDSPDIIDGYKVLRSGDTHFDLALLDMLAEIAVRWNLDVSTFHLVGHSGGGQFVHRFLLIHPGRLVSAAVSAPGRITTIDPEAPWPAGTRDVPEIFGREVDIAAMADVRVLLTAGEFDVETDQLDAVADRSTSPHGSDHVERGRVARLESLLMNLQRNGIDADYRIVTGAGHSDHPTIPAMQDFIAPLLRNSTQGGSADADRA